MDINMHMAYAGKGFAPFSFSHELKMLTITLTRNFLVLHYHVTCALCCV